MLRHDYDHNIVSWIGLPLGVFGGLLASEAGLSLVDISTWENLPMRSPSY